jgi:RNA polymerase sigma-70 factor (ECF subfamily)
MTGSVSPPAPYEYFPTLSELDLDRLRYSFNSVIQAQYSDERFYTRGLVWAMQDQGQTSLSDRLLAEIPRLRVYARLMTNDVARADRGVAEMLQHALSEIEQLRISKALRIYLFMILRDILFSRETALGKAKALPAACDRREGPFQIENGRLDRTVTLATALLRLTFHDREAVVLRAALRLPRMMTATIAGCELHVYDARVRRGFARLAELLPQEALDEAMASRAFYAIDATLEPQEMSLH